MNDDFHEYRRRLPHLSETGAAYFVTWRIARDTPDLAPEERTLIVNALKHFDGERYELIAYVVMNDHVHIVEYPFDDWPIQKLLHTWKSFTANKMQRADTRTGKVWQEESFDRIIRNERDLNQKIDYIINNPLARWPSYAQYPWVWPQS